MATSSRRNFLKRAGAAALALGWAPGVRASRASERVVVGLIGCGGRGRRFFDHADYVCDPDSGRLAEAAKQSDVQTSHAVSDMRRLLDDRSIDAVVIATPDHWHAPAALLALQAGKHVYVEKPISHNFRESQLLLAAARSSQLVVQHGTQQRSSPVMRDAVAMLREGVIGDVLVARAWNVQLRSSIGRAQPSEPPAGVDYDAWVGPAEMLPFQSNRFHYNWHWWHAFGTGDIGNDGSHEIDLARWGLGVDTLPSKVTAMGGKYFHDDDQQFPDTATCVFEYESCAGGRTPHAVARSGDRPQPRRRQLIFEMRIWSTNYPHNCDNGVEFIGTEGKMLLSKRGKLEILGTRNKVIKQERFEFSRGKEHVDDFLDAIRSGRLPSAPVEEAHRSVALVHLANAAIRTGRSIDFDSMGEQIIGDDEAARLLRRTYRDGGHWAIPRGV